MSQKKEQDVQSAVAYTAGGAVAGEFN